MSNPLSKVLDLLSVKLDCGKGFDRSDTVAMFEAALTEIADLRAKLDEAESALENECTMTRHAVQERKAAERQRDEAINTRRAATRTLRYRASYATAELNENDDHADGGEVSGE